MGRLSSRNLVVPYADIESVFLDAGNTLVSIDFDWVAREIRARGFSCEPASLRRAEAAARPVVSRWIAEDRPTEAEESFVFYLLAVLSRLESVAGEGAAAIRRLAEEFVPLLRVSGQSSRLWRWVLPGVSEALESLRSLDLQLVVVSNSDGTVERGLAEVGLRPFFSAIVDSALVGFEKPDPRIFEYALAVSGADRSRVLHVGDLFHVDVEGARAAGLHALLLDPFDDWIGVDCERVADLRVLAERLRTSRA